MMDAKQKNENSHLLETSPPNIRRSRSHERVSLSQLAAERLESLKWLMARDLTVSPPGRVTPRSAGGTPGNRSGGDSGDRKTTWRSSSVDISGNFASESESGGDGAFFTPRTVGMADARQPIVKGPAYRLSIDLERAPAGSSTWVKSRRSSTVNGTSGHSTPRQQGGADLSEMEREEQSTKQDEIPGESDELKHAKQWRRFWTVGGITIAVIWAVTLIFVVGGEMGVTLGFAVGAVVVAVVGVFVSKGESFGCWGDAGESDWLGQIEDDGFPYGSVGEEILGSNVVATMTI